MIPDIRLRYTRHQTPRGTRADAEKGDKLYLFKNVSRLHATYQIRLLAFRAHKEGKKLIIRVPKNCSKEESLEEFLRANGHLVILERV
jgi:hypothetical protein